MVPRIQESLFEPLECRHSALDRRLLKLFREARTFEEDRVQSHSHPQEDGCLSRNGLLKSLATEICGGPDPHDIIKADSGNVRLSATDLANHLACRHLTSLDFAVAVGTSSAPSWQSPDLCVLRERGFALENAYLEHLAAQGAVVLNLRDIVEDERAIAETVAAMEKGAEVIAQATLTSGRWFGRADVLRRVEGASKFGSWSYEVYDCKLARETKAATILQLSLYSELVAAIQGVLPELMYVVPFGLDFRPEQYRVSDFAAYYRYVKARLENAVEQKPTTVVEPTIHCDICRWWPESAGFNGSSF